MEQVASQVVHDLFLGSEMRPRRWYSDEIGPPPRRNVTLDRRTWRYRALIRHKNEDAAPIVGAASKFLRWRDLAFACGRAIRFTLFACNSALRAELQAQ